MPFRKYEDHSFRQSTLDTIAVANSIIERYAAQGYSLTLRQLYYQLVAADLIPNKQTEYKRLGDVVSKARRAGMIDWNAIVDRTRNLQSVGTWDNPQAILNAVSEQFRYDRWIAQGVYVEVWYEKDALMGVFERVCNQLRIPFFSCRGYTSDSEVWSAAQRLRGWREMGAGRDIVILHFGDHDPSGIDMTRDIGDRLRLFGAGRSIDVRRLALNMDQIEQYTPPPNPAKETDSRFAAYQALHGDESWELDALEPTVLAGLVRDEVRTLIEPGAWQKDIAREAVARASLRVLSAEYDTLVEEREVDIAEEVSPRDMVDPLFGGSVPDAEEDEDDEA